MDRFDIVVTGLDPELPRSEVIAGLARRLAKSSAEIEELLERAPAPLARAVSEQDAQLLVADLRALGARVKPRTEGEEIPPEAPKPEKIQLLYWSADEEGYERPRKDAPPEQAAEPEKPDAPTSPTLPVAAPTPIVVRESPDWFTPKSAAGHAPASHGPAAPPLAPTPIPPSLARWGRTGKESVTLAERPRVFFRALPDAFVLPLRSTLLRGHAAAPPIAALAMITGLLGLRCGPEIGPVLVALAVGMAAGFVGVLLQLAGSCLATSAAGERKPLPLPGRLMDDYLRPGALVLLALGVLALGAWYAQTELVRLGASPIVMDVLAAFGVLYTVLGFALSAASGSAFGYVDLARILELVVRAPLRALTVAALGGALLGGAAIADAWLIVTAMHARTPLSFFTYTGGLGALAALGTSYAAAFTGSAMGLLLYATPRPEAK